MRNHLWCIVGLTVSIAACGSKGGGQAEPDGVGRAFGEAVNSQDKALIEAVHPNDETLAGALNCSAGVLAGTIAQSREGFARELDGDLKGVKLEWVGGTFTEEKTTQAGEMIGGCEALVEIVTAKSRWKFKVTKDGETKVQSEGVELIKLGDAGWFLRGM